MQKKKKILIKEQTKKQVLFDKYPKRRAIKELLTNKRERRRSNYLKNQTQKRSNKVLTKRNQNGTI